MHVTMRQSFFIALTFILICPTLNQQILTNMPFECRGRLDGFWRDLRYCDVFHACVAGEQVRSYGCPQVGERFYFSDTTQRCEFTSQNPGGCQANQYYTSISNTPTSSGSQLTTQAPSEQWRIFVQSREQHSCAGQQEGFYPSRWCNVFYRCSDGVSRAFLCPLQQGGGRLWWVGHGSSQVVTQAAAMCIYPCDTGRQCSSAGGIIVDNGNQISESQQAAETAYRQSVCSNQTSQTGVGTGGIQTGLGTGQQGSGQTGTGQSGTGQTGTGQSGTGQTGTGQTGTGQFGTGQTGTGQSGTGQTGGGNQGSSSNTGGKLFSMIS
ncbi:unnamed protein product [Rotaria sordida]|uniref:Chitin-binding type-2 domain-containing protein n=2 Tax=Rotaria sordida TaxID=392033 RepID=A0A814HUL7_9BILA|nr:unnamed protein product [Rotaria sordida]